MVTRSSVALRGQRNQCPTCGELFTRTSAFDKHRVGKHGVDRRCRTREEMEAAGMFKGEDQFWRGARYDEPFYAPRNEPYFEFGQVLDDNGFPVQRP